MCMSIVDCNNKKGFSCWFCHLFKVALTEKEHQNRNQNEVSDSFLLSFVPLMCTLLKICHLTFSQAEQIGHPLNSTALTCTSITWKASTRSLLLFLFPYAPVSMTFPFVT